jgi:hypothetical protein
MAYAIRTIVHLSHEFNDMKTEALKAVVLTLLCFSSFPVFGICQQKAVIGLRLRHGDSIVSARVSVHKQPVQYQPSSQTYLLPRGLFIKPNTLITIEKPGFYPLQLNADSIFKAHRQVKEITVDAVLRHPWDSVYENGGALAPGYAHPKYIMILNVEDTAKVLRVINHLNLTLVRMYDYCGTTKENYGQPEQINTYILMQGDSSNVAKQHSAALSYLRKEFGDDFAGPAMITGGSDPDLLSNQLELRFKQDLPEEKRKAILASFGLTEYSRSNFNPAEIVVKADAGMGDHIIGIAHRLKQIKEIEMVRNLLHTRVCPN